MRKKRSKLICVLITLFLLISGMYFEDFKVDSTFVRMNTETTDSCILLADSVITDTQACTAEMLGIRGNTGLKHLAIRFVNHKKDARTSPEFLCQNVFSLKEGKSYASSEKIQCVSKNSDELVANYIHKSDGKKRI